ncbi:hypothetical protein FRB96_001952 [Tulasnella sp. 330]|nr:hypothetical protein FRB96_001952 [Tulasnella sp. 330]KAG8877719.1 hypothetical protein FRB97_003172 [Tulasnella sp. 331]
MPSPDQLEFAPPHQSASSFASSSRAPQSLPPTYIPPHSLSFHDLDVISLPSPSYDDSDHYVHDHLNDPNYTYRGSVADLHQDTSHVRWTSANPSDDIPLDDKSSLDHHLPPLSDQDFEDCYWEDDSPYPEVRAAVANTDDPTMPTNTFRMWFLGIIFCIFIAGMNQFFSLRYPSITITALVAQLIALPLGKFLQHVLPTRTFTTFGYTWSLNPGPWNIKEHTLVTVMANVVSGGAYATDIIASQRTFYNQHWGVTYQLCLVISSQLIGFSLAGICRRFLVWPAAMIWPATLVNAALFNTLHSMYFDDQVEQAHIEEDLQVQMTGSHAQSSTTAISDNFGIKDRKMTWSSLVPRFISSTSAVRREKSISRSRVSFFVKAFLIGTVWEFFPSYLFTAVSQFTPLCWIFTTPSNVITAQGSSSSITPSGTATSTAIPANINTNMLFHRADNPTTSRASGNPTTPRRNIIINQLFGYSSGLGMGFITFDWALIAYNGSPLVTPWWAELNVFVTLVLVFWIIAPITYYKNVFYSHYLPMSSSVSYDNLGQAYNASRVVIDGIFQPDLYKAYSPLYMPVTFAISYGLSFGTLTATMVHTWLWYRQDIRRQFSASLKDASQQDIHARLMLAYPEVPQWWYAAVGLAAFVLGTITIEVWDTKLPFWAYLVSIGIALVYLVPIGMIQAITNMQVGLNVITELIVGYALPGRPVAMMVFKTFGYITMTQALSFVSDLKLGHYMKIPPRMMFWTQTVAALIACFVVVGVQGWMFGNIPGLCHDDQRDKFICPEVRVFSTASLIWGGIGPARAFNHGSLYYPTLYFFIIGAILPIPFYFLAKASPRSWYKFVNIPVAFTGIGNLPPSTGINYSSWALVGFVFQYWIRRRHFVWWSRYNYIFSAALDAGVAVGTILVFFSLAFPGHGGIIIDWWGNNVNDNTPDTLGTPLKVMPPGEIFGLQEWS